MQLATAIGTAALLLIPEATPVTDYNRALGSNKGSKSLSTSKSSKSKSSKSKKSKKSKSSKSSKLSKISKSKSKHQPYQQEIFETQEFVIDGICGKMEEVKEKYEAACLDFFETEFDDCGSDQNVQSMNLVQWEIELH